jgi:hypothetical protein
VNCTDSCTCSHSLAGSPPKAAEDAAKSGNKDAANDKATPLSPSHDDYPRPEDHHHQAKSGEEGESKEDKKKDDHEQQGTKKKEKPVFEHPKEKNLNKNPPIPNNFSIKQPAGKVM